ncbi:MAG: DUF3467 domain-containing protein [Deltaproteobacteria bacterium]|nr:MAG: DUF3467 domain-containing protein [Deltaproteobacteria bacterium]
MSKQPEKKEVNVQIQLDEEMAQGVYVNLAMVNHTETEFTIDFIYVQPQNPRGKVRARVISSPNHTKRLINALLDNMQKYEDKFGKIELPSTPPEKIGFLH